MTLKPLSQDDPRLRQVCAPLTRVQLREREQQLEIDALVELVWPLGTKPASAAVRDQTRPSTVGLSANQAGIMKQICVVDLAIGHRGYTDLHMLVNPKIIWRGKAMVKRTEGCVNFPTTWGVTERSRSVRVAAWDRSGNEIELKLVGWPASLLQHELVHLEGHLFIDRMLDPAHAHLVTRNQYATYRKSKPEDWRTFVDMSGKITSVTGE